MKSKLTAAIALLMFSVVLNSCYKTGEVIYQRKCGVVSFNLQTEKLYNTIFFPASANSVLNSSITYANIPVATRRTTVIEEDKINPSQPYHIYHDFFYDNNNNLSYFRWVSLDDIIPNGGNSAELADFVFTYPQGAINSISSTLKVQRYSSGYPNSTPLDSPYTYNFNTESQLTSITDYYNQVLQTFEYDNGGNCTKNTVYGPNNTIAAVWEYLSYDDKINPCRTDRTLQLYYNIYSKNNPTNVRLTVYDDKGVVQTYNNTYSYTYNSDNYAFGIVGFTKPYANYICPIP